MHGISGISDGIFCVGIVGYVLIGLCVVTARHVYAFDSVAFFGSGLLMKPLLIEDAAIAVAAAVEEDEVYALVVESAM